MNKRAKHLFTYLFLSVLSCSNSVYGASEPAQKRAQLGVEVDNSQDATAQQAIKLAIPYLNVKAASALALTARYWHMAIYEHRRKENTRCTLRNPLKLNLVESPDQYAALQTVHYLHDDLQEFWLRLYFQDRLATQLRGRHGSALEICSKQPYPELPIQPTILAPLIRFVYSLMNQYRCGLTSIDLRSQTATTIEPTIFQGLATLRNICLNSTRLVSLDPALLQGVRNLRELHLNNTGLVALDPALLRELMHLQTIDLRNNQLTTLAPTIFQGLSELQRLELGNNRLVTLDEHIFRGLGKLEILTLYQNNLKSLPAQVFEGLHQLKLLALQLNQDIMALAIEQFSDLHNLVGLALPTLTRLDPALFKGLNKVERLNLGRIKTLDGRIFTQLPSLKKLIVSKAPEQETIVVPPGVKLVMS